MSTLVSPGVSVTVIDESQTTSSGQGTVPLIFIATEANKVGSDGVTIAPGTQTSGSLYLSTSQMDLITEFGSPIFEVTNGTPVQGSEISEYGLHAAYSYLGLANRAYVIRADIDLSQLAYSETPPSSPPANGTYWFNLTNTSFGIFVANGNSTPGLAWNPVTPLIPTTAETTTAGSMDPSGAVAGAIIPSNSFGSSGNFAVVTLQSNNAIYQKILGQWYLVGTSVWSSAVGSSNTLVYAPHTQVPVGTNAGNVWIKTTNPNYGANYVVEVFSTQTNQFSIVTAPFYASDSAATTGYGSALAIGSLYVLYNSANNTTAQQTIRYYTGSAWENLTYTASLTAPTNPPVDGTLWISDAFQVDIMVNTGNTWEGYLNKYPATDPNGVQITSAQPTTQSTGAPLADQDLWLDSDAATYPSLYRWSATSSSWTLIDNTDLTTPFGIVFADARSTNGVGATDTTSMLTSNYVDPDAPNPETFPAGLLIFNTRYSTYNVKSYDSTKFANQASYTVGNFTVSSPELAYLNANPQSWVTASGNDVNGTPFMGRFAQHQMVVLAMRSLIESNDAIRSEFNYFNLMAAPNYPELDLDMMNLNVDRKETAFLIVDTPMHLTASATALNNWATNAANASETNESGRVTQYTYSAEYYPQGLGVDPTTGNSVAIPSSTIALATYAYNDSVAYPWFSPAGTQRGIVQNATSVGYVDPTTGLFVPVILNQGQRDTLYLNDINPIAQLPNTGLIVYGDKTLEPGSDTALSRVNVARLVCYLRAQLDSLAQPFLFQLNTETTRNSVESIFSRYLGDLLSLQAITDFAVVCDTTNNTPETIDANELWIDVAIVPSKSINFIYIPIRIMNTGTVLS